MKYEEAKEQLDMAIEVASGEMAVVLLKAFEAVKKQIPKKVRYEFDGYADGNPVYDEAYCPLCDCLFEEYRDWEVDYCPHCGQRLDWSFDES